MFDQFIKEKEEFLRKKDKSKKGYVDKDILQILKLINSNNNYYTTSSCSGRIVLLVMKSRKKNESDLIINKHDTVNFDEIIKPLRDKTKNEIWFKQQPLILHVACRNIEFAKKFLDISRKLFRRAGIIGISDRKIVIEVIGTENMEAIVADETFVADEAYLNQIIKYANRNFVENKKKCGRFLNILKKLR